MEIKFNESEEKIFNSLNRVDGTLDRERLAIDLFGPDIYDNSNKECTLGFKVKDPLKAAYLLFEILYNKDGIADQLGITPTRIAPFGIPEIESIKDKVCDIIDEATTGRIQK